MFVGHWYSSNRDIMYLVCQSISQNNVIEPCYSLSGNSLFYAPTLSSLVAIEIVVEEISLATIGMVIWVCQMVLQVHLIKRLSYFMGETSSQ